MTVVKVPKNSIWRTEPLETNTFKREEAERFHIRNAKVQGKAGMQHYEKKG